MMVEERFEENTYKNYKSAINNLYQDFQEKLGTKTEIDMIKKIDNDFLEDYFRELKKIYRVATVNQRIAVLHDYFKYVVNAKRVIVVNPIQGIEQYAIKQEDKKEKYIPTKDDIRRLLTACDIRAKGERDFEYMSARDKFIISFLATNGARISELLDARMDMLEKNDIGYAINLDSSQVKNDIQKRLLITGQTLDYFNDYLTERSAQIQGREDADLNIVLSARGRACTCGNINDMLKKKCFKAGITMFSSHSFRHFVTTSLVDMQVSENITNISLGWKMAGMTSVYGNHLERYDDTRVDLMKKII